MVGVTRVRLRTVDCSALRTGQDILSIAALSTSCRDCLQRRQCSLASEPTVAPYLHEACSWGRWGHQLRCRPCGGTLHAAVTEKG